MQLVSYQIHCLIELTIYRIAIVDNTNSIDVHGCTEVDWQPRMSRTFSTWTSIQVSVNGQWSHEGGVSTALNCRSQQCHVHCNSDGTFHLRPWKQTSKNVGTAQKMWRHAVFRKRVLEVFWFYATLIIFVDNNNNNNNVLSFFSHTSELQFN